ncbi:helix-turn-helix domain-containing protein [Marinifilum sp. N1E240]|uniref:helix-turn-helix domain-containing protein n=1 Tax=Marinifilum sp. N1E240 TaxID=2608082 RepID=UPI00128D4E7A|nr:helix-turn-helix transcriptional regulator [Marinifilum sp. N1E240]MPQ48115.1 helix-turn-helix domain-containing protein [Marinifilum sp. N1E240]
MSVGERLKKIRQERKISQNEFAEILNVSRSTYLLVEKGEREINFKMIESLHKQFEISSDWLLFGTEASENSSNDSEELISRRIFELSLLTPCLTHFKPFIESLESFAQKDSKTYERIKAIHTGIDEILETSKLINNIKTKTEYSLFDKSELELSRIVDLQFWEILKKVQELTRYINISDPDNLQSIVPIYYNHIENYLGGLEQQIKDYNNFINQKNKATE